METLNSSGKNSSLENSPWQQLQQGTKSWNSFSPRDRESIIRHYAPKVKIIALRLKVKLPQHIDVDELISAGSLGLLEALDKFDPTLGIQFSTFSETRIKGAMLDELRRLDWFSRGMRQKIRLLEQTILAIEQRRGTSPTTEELQESTGLSEEEVKDGLEALQSQVSLSIEAIQDTLAHPQKDREEEQPFQAVAKQELIDKIALLVDELTPREKLVLSLYYTEELNMKETAEVMDVTEGRVSQLHSQSLGKLRSKFRHQYGEEE